MHNPHLLVVVRSVIECHVTPPFHALFLSTPFADVAPLLLEEEVACPKYLSKWHSKCRHVFRYTYMYERDVHATWKKTAECSRTSTVERDRGAISTNDVFFPLALPGRAPALRLERRSTTATEHDHFPSLLGQVQHLELPDSILEQQRNPTPRYSTETVESAVTLSSPESELYDCPVSTISTSIASSTIVGGTDKKTHAGGPTIVECVLRFSKGLVSRFCSMVSLPPAPVLASPSILG